MLQEYLPDFAWNKKPSIRIQQKKTSTTHAHYSKFQQHHLLLKSKIQNTKMLI
jgi:hypothetical protein